MVTTNVLQADIIGRGARGFRLTNYSNGQLTAVSSQRPLGHVWRSKVFIKLFC